MFLRMLLFPAVWALQLLLQTQPQRKRVRLQLRKWFQDSRRRVFVSLKHFAQTQLGDPEKWQELMKGYAFGRAAKPEEIGWMAAFLASERSGYTTGTIVTIDGGGGSRRSAL